ncbi:hypothetical protein FKP32DRAFT_5751 [Trametes sanguinea]|nr:hypothetical protein FKP32DRAFT_5751 [Trametes sanguinea]
MDPRADRTSSQGYSIECAKWNVSPQARVSKDTVRHLHSAMPRLPRGSWCGKSAAITRVGINRGTCLRWEAVSCNLNSCEFVHA